MLYASLAGAFFTFSYLSKANAAAVEAATEAEKPTLKVDKTAFDDLTLAAKSAEIYDVQTGQSLYEQNADAQLPLASLTKIAMTQAILDVLPPDAHITLPEGTASTGSAVGLPAKSTWKAQDLIDFTLIASLNDGAAILAEAADESIRARYPPMPPQTTQRYGA